MYRIGAFLKELRRRRMFRVAALYIIGAWVALQVADLAFPGLGIPDSAIRYVWIAAFLGFPIALIFGWRFDFIGGHLIRTPASESAEPNLSLRRTDYLILAALAVMGSIVTFGLLKELREVRLPDLTDAGEIDPKSIAVLPFADQSAAEENAAFLAYGIHDDLLTLLSRLGGLKVISKTSVEQYRETDKPLKQIGRELGVARILEGGVQRAGDRVRINVQLLDANTDTHLWANTYDERLTATNIFTVQTQVARSIATHLQVAITSQEQERIETVPTRNYAALEAYFRGRQMLSLQDAKPFEQAVEYFQLAIKLEPEFALAYAGLAEAWLQAPTNVPQIDIAMAHELAAEAADRALAIDPSLPAALAVAGWQKLLHDYDWNGAEDHFIRALEVEPSNVNALHWYSHLLSWEGDYDAALKLTERAIASDPLSTLLQTHLCGVFVQARSFDEAFSLGEKILQRESYPLLMRIMISGYLRAGRAQDAAEMLKAWAGATGRDMEAAIELADLIVRNQQTGELIPIPKKLFERLRMIEVVTAWVYAFVGDKDMAISMLQQAHQGRFGQIGLLDTKRNPLFESLADDPRFVAIAAQIGPAD